MYASIYLSLLLSIFLTGLLLFVPVFYLLLSDFWFYSIVLFSLYVFYRINIYLKSNDVVNSRECFTDISETDREVAEILVQLSKGESSSFEKPKLRRSSRLRNKREKESVTI
jgi:hypothetical protein